MFSQNTYFSFAVQASQQTINSIKCDVCSSECMSTDLLQNNFVVSQSLLQQQGLLGADAQQSVVSSPEESICTGCDDNIVATSFCQVSYLQ